MGGEFGVLDKLLIALRALERLLPRMVLKVRLKMAPPDEAFATLGALVRSLPRVPPLVLDQLVLPLENFPTLRTFQLFLCGHTTILPFSEIGRLSTKSQTWLPVRTSCLVCRRQLVTFRWQNILHLFLFSTDVGI